jgi:hypothetical protein
MLSQGLCPVQTPNMIYDHATVFKANGMEYPKEYVQTTENFLTKAVQKCQHQCPPLLTVAKTFVSKLIQQDNY